MRGEPLGTARSLEGKRIVAIANAEAQAPGLATADWLLSSPAAAR